MARGGMVADGTLESTSCGIVLYDGFGIATFIFPLLLFLTGLNIILNIPVKQLKKYWINGILAMIWLSWALAFLIPQKTIFAGTIGDDVNDFAQL